MGPVHIFGLLWIYTSIPIQVLGTGSFQLRINSFTNTYGYNSDNNCCSGVKDHSGYCSSSCRTFFKICLKEFQTHISTDSPKCTFGSYTTTVFEDNSFYFVDSSNNQLFQNPISLHFKFSWPGTFSLIVEAWHDLTGAEATQGSMRELIIQEAMQGTVIASETWTDKTYPKDNKELNYSYRVVCDDSYYGSECEVLCKERDDDFGHSTCDTDGNRICMEGWTGVYCDKAICLPGCQGSCEKPNECKCKLGWQGNICTQCIRYPGCKHGTCEQPWQCNCDEGWGGVFCTEDLNYCTHNKPCKNGAACTNTGEGSYTCECAPGFAGTNCERTINDCLNQPCENGGTCTQQSENQYICQCPPEFQGRHCQSSFTSCEENPCQHGSTCVPQQFASMSYRCECSEGYSGINCEIEVDDCSPNPCENDGRCVDERNGFRCVCIPGFSGKTCSENKNDCSISPCLNGATCTDHVNEFQCHCPVGFRGDLCQENVNECDTAQCANGGTCHDLINNFVCDCAAGFGGKECRVNIDECEARPCQNGGGCTDLNNDYSCQCINGYHGKNCEFPEGQTGYPSTTKNTDISLTGGVSTTPSSNIVEVTTTQHSGGSGGSARPMVQDESIITLQVTLYICLGVGIPCVIIIVVLVFLLIRRWKHHREDSSDDNSSVQKDNERNEEANMNNRARNKTKSIENDILSPSSVSLKITNEEQQQQSSSRTINSNATSNHILDTTTKNNILVKNNLNRDQNIVSKLYPKELNVSKTKDYRHLNSRDSKDCCSSSSSHSSSNILDSNKLLARQQGIQQQSCFPTPVLSTLESASNTEISDAHLYDSQHLYHHHHHHQQPQQQLGVADVHVVKPSNKDLGSGASSIYYLENNHNPIVIPQYTEGVLATEV